MMPTSTTPPPGDGRTRPRRAPASPGARPTRARVGRGLLPILLLWGSVWAGCVEERSSIDLQRVPMPEGGSVYTVAVLDGVSGPTVIAPSHAGLFVHHEDRGAWERIEPRTSRATLQNSLVSPRPADPSDTLTPTRQALNFRPSELFSAHGGRIWLAPGLAQSPGQQLLSSQDLGRTWTPVPLPRLPTPAPDPAANPDPTSPGEPGDDATSSEEDAADEEEPAQDSASQQDTDAPQVTANPAHLRFVNAGGLGFYLMGASNLWKFELSPDAPLGDTASPDALWVPVSLAGAELENDANRTRLPNVLRHYLPAAPERPYELLTMLRERLYIYRRDADAERFEEVSMLDGADFQLAAIPDSNLVLILTSEGLFKSDDAGTSWTQLTWYALSQDNARGTSMQILAPTPEAPATLLVALETGALYRSEDLGETFTEVRPPDPDQRGITDFGYSQPYDRVWAATNGSGVLRSLDRGKTWQPINDELRATRVSDIGADESDGFLLASESGLYRLSGPPRAGQWQMLQPRATTAIRVEPASGAILSGTTTGAIVRLETSGKSTVSQASPEQPNGATAFRAPRFRGLEMPARAIVAIEVHPDDPQVYAWSANRGPLASLDSGVSWTPLALNSAFESALEGSYISNFTTEVGERIYLVTRGLSAAAPTQLWRSYNNGETWHAVFSFERGEHPSDVFLAHNTRMAPENIFMAHRDRFARSLDGGNSWRDFKGPWSDGEILLYELIDNKHLLIVERHQSTHLVQVSDTEQERASFRSYQLSWPARPGVDRADIHGIAVQGGHFFLSTDRGLFTGKMPDDNQRLPNGLAVLVALISVALLTVIGFGVMRLTT